jgi:hypothetical protein
MDACVWGKLPGMELKLIFARLPLKDIVRLQALNTHWKLLIRSSSFQQHMAQAIFRGGARFGLLTQVIKGPRSLCWDFHIFDAPACERNHFPLSGPPDTISTAIFPITAAAGLVCMSNVYGERIFVVNPVTNVCRKLPQDHISGNMSGWTKCQFLAMALMEIIIDNHQQQQHKTRRQGYTLTIVLSQKPWPEGSNLSSLLCEKRVNVSHFSFSVYDSAADRWSKRDTLNDPNLLRNKVFRLFPSGAPVMASTDALGNQVFHLIPRSLDVL